MKEHKYVIKSKLKPGKYLAGLGLGSCNHLFPDVWTNHEATAMRCTWEQARQIVKFIREAVDETIGYTLYITEYKGKEPWEEK